jgi:hypothetical protein
MLNAIRQAAPTAKSAAAPAPVAKPVAQDPTKKNMVPVRDSLELSRPPFHTNCFPIHPPVPPIHPIPVGDIFEEFNVKNKGVTGEASIKTDFRGFEQVYVKGENGKTYRLTGAEAEAVKAAIKAADPFEKVEVTVKGDLHQGNRMNPTDSIETDSVSIDVKSRFEREFPVWPRPLPQDFPRPIFNASV